jgi:superfamily II DNA or RNA helicase
LLSNHILDSVENLLPEMNKIPVRLNLDLYENQQLLINYLNAEVFTQARIDDGSACALLNLRAGMGKTFVAGGIIARLGLRTLYVVPKRPLMIQAVKDLRACFYPDDGTIPNTYIGAYGKTKKKDPSSNVANQGITVIVINSALERDEAFFRGYSLVIYDEVHSYCSETRREIFRKCSTNVCLGMSATTEDRNDGFDPIAHKELAFDGIIRAENVPGFTYEDVKFDCRAKLINYSGPAEHTHNLTHEATGNIFVSYMYKQYLRDQYRLKLVVDELIALYDWRGENGQKHNVYLFAEEIDLLKIAMEALQTELNKRERADIADDLAVPELGLEMFTGGLKDDQVTRIASEGRVLCSTYGYAGTGVSIPKMSCIMFLTPRKAQMKQILARILRRGSDMSIPRHVIDIIDTKTCLRYQVGARMIAYDHYGFETEKVKVKYTDIVVVTENV